MKNEEMNEEYARRLQSDVERAVDSQPTEAERHAMWQKCSETVFCEYFVKSLVDAGCTVAIAPDGTEIGLHKLANDLLHGVVTHVCGTWGHPDNTDEDELTIKNPFTEPCACHIPDLHKNKVILNGIVYEVGKRLGPWEKGYDAYDGTAWQLRPEEGVIYNDQELWDKSAPRWEK